MDPVKKEIPPHVAAVLKDAIEVSLPTPDDFLKVKETLTRIGVASRKNLNSPSLFQSCHILHKQGRYYIMSFKELFLLDGKASQTQFTEDDKARRNTIANMLAAWGLVVLVHPAKSAEPIMAPGQVTVIPFRDKSKWQLIPKYEIGKRRT
jgi:hypothetical protein